MSAGAFLWRKHEGKEPYTREQAEARAAERNKKSGRRHTTKAEAYCCPVCEQWHVGTSSYAKNKSMRQRTA